MLLIQAVIALLFLPFLLCNSEYKLLLREIIPAVISSRMKAHLVGIAPLGSGEGEFQHHHCVHQLEVQLQ